VNHMQLFILMSVSFLLVSMGESWAAPRHRAVAARLIDFISALQQPTISICVWVRRVVCLLPRVRAP
jgi:hypothetical protein